MDRASLNPLREAQTDRRADPRAARRAPRPAAQLHRQVRDLRRARRARRARAGGGERRWRAWAMCSRATRCSARTLRPMVKLLMRGTLGGKQSRLILQNPDDADAFVRARLVPEQQIRVIRSSGVNLERFLPVDARAPNASAARAARCAPAVGEGHRGVHRSRAHAARAGPQRSNSCIAGSPDPGNPRSVSQRAGRELGRRGAGRLARPRRRHAGADALRWTSWCFRASTAKACRRA